MNGTHERAEPVLLWLHRVNNPRLSLNTHQIHQRKLLRSCIEETLRNVNSLSMVSILCMRPTTHPNYNTSLLFGECQLSL